MKDSVECKHILIFLISPNVSHQCHLDIINHPQILVKVKCEGTAHLKCLIKYILNYLEGESAESVECEDVLPHQCHINLAVISHTLKFYALLTSKLSSSSLSTSLNINFPHPEIPSGYHSHPHHQLSAFQS